MEVWGPGPFDNAPARDWAMCLDALDDSTFVEDALDAVLAVGEDPLEASEAAEGLAAAEVVARWSGSSGKASVASAPADAWVEAQSAKPQKSVLRRAHRAVRRVLEPDSQLLQFWKRRPDAAAWTREVEALAERLRAAAPKGS